MAWATCVKCGKDVHWHGCRGSRMADARCACGGDLQGLTTGRKGGGNTGRKIEACAVCGRRGFRLLHPAGSWIPRYMSFHQEAARSGWGLEHPFPACAPCCGRHEPWEVDPKRHRFDDWGQYVGGEDKRGTCAFCYRPQAEHERQPAAPGDADGKVQG